MSRFNLPCGCVVTDIMGGSITFCPMHQDAPETLEQRDRLLEQLQTLTAFVQQELMPNIRSIEGGQRGLDRAWDVIAAAWAALVDKS